jgi:osmoprotectant transport system permease protein
MRGLAARAGLVLVVGLAGGASAAGAGEGLRPVVVGSKTFTESVILGEAAAHLISDQGVSVEHRRQLGGTQVLWNALLKGDIDVYPEYTGTIREEILAGRDVSQPGALEAALRRVGVTASRPLGFNDTYALGMKKERAAALGVATISDLGRHPELKLGFSNEFMDRKDGWPGLSERYGLAQRDVRGLDHDLAYRGLESGAIDVTDLYSTDAEIAWYDLVVLSDDRNYFPEYQAVWLRRVDLEERAPRAVGALTLLEGRVDEAAMIAMNRRAKLDRVPETVVAADFLKSLLGRSGTVRPESRSDRLLRRTGEHLSLVGISLFAAILVALPLGILAGHNRRAGQMILGVAGVIQTIPSLALLVFMIPWLGIGTVPAIVALFLYSLLPIIRNTATGLESIPLPLRESAAALGLGKGARLFQIELPLASRSILSGIKTSAVINVGTATLGALIGAGGYGQPILTGIRLDNPGLILEGAIPAALLALLAQGFFETLERFVVPKGLRLKAETL